MIKKVLPNILALFCVFVWGVTFISTKVLLRYFNPTTILVYRLSICLIFLFLVNPKIYKLYKKIDELYFLAAGAFGITFYFLFENIAIKYTSASSVGIIVSLAPMFTLLFCSLVFKDQKISLNFIVGFIVAILGIILISLDSLKETSEISMKGIILASFAMICWGFYSVFVKKINILGYQGVGATRKIMYYGLICLIPFYFVMKGKLNIDALSIPKVTLNLLFLGLVASALCFVLWNYSVLNIGPVKCNIYLYLSPAITMIASSIILKEKITIIIFLGLILSILGLIISNDLWSKKKLKQEDNNVKIIVEDGVLDEGNTCQDERDL